jgi:phosphotransacetylase
MTNWIKTPKGNYTDISKAYLLEVGSAKKIIFATNKEEIEWQIRAFFLGDEGFCIIKTFNTEKEAREYLDDMMKKLGYTELKESK